MTTIQLQQSVLQDIAYLLDDNEAMKKLQKLLWQLRKEKAAKEEMSDEELDAVLENLPLQRISGLPYTYEERIESLQQAEENIVAGKVRSHETVMAEMRERIQTWK